MGIVQDDGMGPRLVSRRQNWKRYRVYCEPSSGKGNVALIPRVQTGQWEHVTLANFFSDSSQRRAAEKGMRKVISASILVTAGESSRKLKSSGIFFILT